MTESPKTILQKYWGYTRFNPLQEEIINYVLNGNDAVVLLPTGGGKSLCYQIPAMVKEGICLVLTPLIALMDDQTAKLKSQEIKAIALGGNIHFDRLNQLLDNATYGNYKFLYLSPERFQQPLVQERLEQMNINFIAIDEAHCISQWGHDFRPAYLALDKLKEIKPNVPIIALTATAKPKVVDEICTHLQIPKANVFKGNFHRDNLAIYVKNTEDKLFQLVSEISNYQESCIVYVRSRNEAEKISNHLNQNAIKSAFFHGGLSHDNKLKRLEEWKTNATQVMVATTAFGMGIDKKDVRLIVHYSLPESLESYYQEIGRAGRDGLLSKALTLIDKQDEPRLIDQFLKALPEVAELKLIYRKLCSFLQIPFGEGSAESFALNFKKFCDVYGFHTIRAYNALEVLDRNSVIQLEQNFKFKSTLKFEGSTQSIFKYLENNRYMADMVQVILRTYGGIFDHELPINLELISKKANIPTSEIITKLQQMHTDGIVIFQNSATDTQITFLEPREDDATINRIASNLNTYRKLKEKNINAVLHYINSESNCKMKELASYFGETMDEDCGICIVCKQKHNPRKGFNYKLIRNEIVTMLETGPKSSRQLLNSLKLEEGDILETLRRMLEDQILEITETNKYKLRFS